MIAVAGTADAGHAGIEGLPLIYLPADTSMSNELNNFPRRIEMYCQSEAIARERIRERLKDAANRRLASEVASVQMWQRIAAYCTRRASRSQRRLSEHSGAANYDLAG